MDKRIQVSIRYKGKHFIIGNEWKSEQFNDDGTIGQLIGEYIDDQLNFLTEREQDDDEDS